jgi:hypothetical protein
MDEPSSFVAEKLIDLPLERARMRYWNGWRDPHQHLYSKLLDALNCAEEAERQSKGEIFTVLKGSLILQCDVLRADYKRGAVKV